MRLYSLYQQAIKDTSKLMNMAQRVNKENTKGNIINTPSICLNVSDTISYASYILPKTRKVVVTDTDRQQLVPFITGNKFILSSKSEPISMNLKHTGIIRKIKNTVTLDDLKETIESLTIPYPKLIEPKHIVQILDVFLLKLHEFNVKEYGLPLTIFSVNKDIQRVWNEDSEEEYDLVSDIITRFANSRKQASMIYKAQLMSKGEYRSFMNYAREEVECLYLILSTLGS